MSISYVCAFFDKYHFKSDVLSVTFSPFHSNLVFGGTYSGQILLWDTRSKHLPVLKTPLSAAGHTHPVYAMQMVGTQNAHNLITSSTDGTVCSWVVDMLAQPQVSLLTVEDYLTTEFVRRKRLSLFMQVITRPVRSPSQHSTSLTTRQPRSGSALKKAMCTKPIDMTARAQRRD